jgi:hypothetical protein
MAGVLTKKDFQNIFAIFEFPTLAGENASGHHGRRTAKIDSQFDSPRMAFRIVRNLHRFCYFHL